MTLDVTIGKVVIEQSDEGHAFAWVEMCPIADTDISNPNMTITPKEAYRSGSTSFWEFWRKNDKLAVLYNKMRDHPNSNDGDVTFLEKYKDDLLSLSVNAFDSSLDKDRLLWLKYWVKKAVQLYGKEAGLMFG